METKDSNWSVIPGFPKYKVSQYGKVENIETGGILSCRDDGRGYLCCNLIDCNNSKRTVKIHRIVWLAFRGPVPPGKHVDHIDHDKMNPALSNLRLRDSRENSADNKKTSRAGCRVLIREQRRAVAVLCAAGFGTKDIAQLCNIGASTVRRIKRDIDIWIDKGIEDD